MNLVVDYGNTSVKVGIFDQHVLVEKKTITSAEDLQKLLALSAGENMIVSSVHHQATDIAGWAVKVRRKLILDDKLPLPVRNHYVTPDTLGVDRIAGVCGAIQLFPDSDTLVIDAGTCITYDFVDANRNYWGGSISPGLSMRFRAIHEFTARLPLIEPAGDPVFLGDSTATAIQSGIQHGIQAEIEGFILRYQNKYKELKIVMTGGDAGFFENRLKASIFASPNLVLIGLNSILIYNVDR